LKRNREKQIPLNNISEQMFFLNDNRILINLIITRMKKLFLLLGLCLLFTAQLVAQSRSDKALILQKCIDLQELQQSYPVAADGTISQIYVLQHGISFPENIEVSKSGKPLAFVSKSDINDQHIESFFLFWTFDIVNDQSHVQFTYNNSKIEKKATIVELNLQKENNVWTIVKSKIERR